MGLIEKKKYGSSTGVLPQRGIDNEKLKRRGDLRMDRSEIFPQHLLDRFREEGIRRVMEEENEAYLREIGCWDGDDEDEYGDEV